MPFAANATDREKDKFVEHPSGETSVRVFVANESTSPVEVSGAIGVSAPTGPFTITTITVTDVAANPLAAPLDDRVSLSIRNKSVAETIYFGKNAGVTPDNNAVTGGWEIGPGEDFNIDLDDGNLFFLIAEAGKTAIIKILEIASNAVGGGAAVAGTEIQEPLAGLVNGINTAFTVTQTPASSGSFKLYIDGTLRNLGTHYTRVGTAVTILDPPLPGQTPVANYVY